MYYYNSWDADFKQPFGAIQVGQIMKVNLQTDKENVTAKFIIRRDFGARSEFDMQKLEEEFLVLPSSSMLGKGFTTIILKSVNQRIGASKSFTMAVAALVVKAYFI